MLETAAFLFGLGFSAVVYVRSIRTARLAPGRKLFVLLLSSAGITGMVWLCGVVVAYFLRKFAVL